MHKTSFGEDNRLRFSRSESMPAHFRTGDVPEENLESETDDYNHHKTFYPEHWRLTDGVWLKRS